MAGAGPILRVSNQSLHVLGTHNTHFCFYLSSLKFLYFPLSHAYSDIHIGCKTLHLVTLCKTSNLINGFSSFRVKRGGRGRFIRRDSNQMVTEAYLPLGNMQPAKEASLGFGGGEGKGVFKQVLRHSASYNACCLLQCICHFNICFKNTF